jgi:mRNA-degrading endonuclease toxin of MazEF toxin-antitoxin module
VWLDPVTETKSGLRGFSYAVANNLMTVAQVKVFRRIGELSASAMRQIEAKVTLALELP